MTRAKSAHCILLYTAQQKQTREQGWGTTMGEGSGEVEDSDINQNISWRRSNSRNRITTPLRDDSKKNSPMEQKIDQIDNRLETV